MPGKREMRNQRNEPRVQHGVRDFHDRVCVFDGIWLCVGRGQVDESQLISRSLPSLGFVDLKSRQSGGHLVIHGKNDEQRVRNTHRERGDNELA